MVHASKSVGPASAHSNQNKQYHVSKVYFYSVSDVLQQEQTDPIENDLDQNPSEQHVSILDCETGRVRRGYAQPSNHFTGKLNF